MTAKDDFNGDDLDFMTNLLDDLDIPDLPQPTPVLPLPPSPQKNTNPFDVSGVQTFQNQDELGDKIATWFSEGPENIHAFIYAPTQSGKTGSMLRTCYHMYERMGTLPQNTYVITTLSSNEWKSQTKDRFPRVMAENIWHLHDIKRATSHMQLVGKQDVLIIIDEMHWGANGGGVLHKFMEAHKFNNTHQQGCFTMKEMNVRMVHVTATPEDSWTLMEKTWGAHSKHFHMFDAGEEPEGYVSIKKLYEASRILQCGPLVLSGNPRLSQRQKEEEKVLVAATMRRFLSKVFIEFGVNNPKYHVIRCPTTYAADGTLSEQAGIDRVHRAILRCMGDRSSIINIHRVHSQVQNDEFREINSHLCNAPTKHTFLLIKEGVRCAITLEPKDHIGIMYERYVASSAKDKQIEYIKKRQENCAIPANKKKLYESRESTVVQSLAGRLTGYNDNGESVAYTDVGYVKVYVRMTYEKNGKNANGWYVNTTQGPPSASKIKYFMKDPDAEDADEEAQENHRKLSSQSRLYITNVNMERKVENNNYTEQKDREERGLFFTWFVRRNAPICMGDMMAFSVEDKQVDIRVVLNIGTVNKQTPGSADVGSDKMVLYLSKTILNLPWRTWIQRFGHFVRADRSDFFTYQVRVSVTTLIEYIRVKLLPSSSRRKLILCDADNVDLERQFEKHLNDSKDEAAEEPIQNKDN
jgi:hypothetical protein